MEYIKVKNFHKYQHYSDRSMVWFKWHVDCLYDYEFTKLTNRAKWVFIGFICLACKSKNRIPNDSAWIQKQISTHDEPIDEEIRLLLASGMLAECYQDASLDKIREDKKREEQKREEENGCLQAIMLHFKKLKKIEAVGDSWEKTYFPRYRKPAQQMLSYIGAVPDVLACMNYVVADLSEKKLSWEFDTIVKKMADWKRDRDKIKEADAKRKQDTEAAKRFISENAGA